MLAVIGILEGVSCANALNVDKFTVSVPSDHTPTLFGEESFTSSLVSKIVAIVVKGYREGLGASQVCG